MSTKKAQPARTSGIKVNTRTITTISATDGRTIKEGDIIALNVKNETIVCSFQGLSAGGYFVTRPFMDPGQEVKYRVGSIDTCYKVKAFELEKDEAQPAADPADQQALAEA